MAKELLHIIDEKLFQSGWVSSERVRTIRYGKCLNPPYVENQLWFVTIPYGLPDRAIYPDSDDREALEPREETTFLVNEQYARPNVIDDLKRDIEKWQKVAHKTIVGDWCVRHECLWNEVPIHEHQLPGGEIIKYGYCLTPKDNPNRDLWFVAWQKKETDSFPTQNGTIILVVDELCTDRDFLNHLGINTRKWVDICWVAIDDSKQWDDYETGFSMKFVEMYQLENANGSVGELSEIDKKISLYQNEITAKRRASN